MHGGGGNRDTGQPEDPPSFVYVVDRSLKPSSAPFSTPYQTDGSRSDRGLGVDNQAFSPTDGAGLYDTGGRGGGDVRDGRGGGDGRDGRGEPARNLRTSGWAERDVLDYDVIDDDEELEMVEDRCMGEMRLNCTRFRSALVEQGHEMKHTFSKMDLRKAARSMISLDGLKQRVPIIGWAPKYSLDDLQGDVIAGVTVGLTLIPQSIAYAGIAQLAPQYGLYTSFIGPFIYLVLGCSKDIALGPSAIASLMTLSYAKPFFGRDPTVAIWLGLYTGIVQLIMYFIGFGYLLDFISFPVLKAFSVSCAITIGMSQVKKWWGLKGVPGDFIPQLIKTFEKLPKTRLYDFLLGLVSVFFIVLFKKLKEIKFKTKYEDMPTKWKILSKALWFIGTSKNTLVIISTSIAAYIFEIHGMVPFSLTGKIPPGIPSWSHPPFTVTDPATNITYSASDIPSRIGHGFIVVPLISVIEGMSIGKVCARKFDYKYDTNQEFLPYGIANVLNSFVQGYAASGTYSRTAVQSGSGVRTPAANIVIGAIVLLALSFLTPLFYYIPHASLGVVIIMAVLDTITFHKIWIFWKTKRIDLIPWTVTFILSFILSIEYGIAIGCLVQLVIMLYETWRPTVKVYDYAACSTSLDQANSNADSSKVIVIELSTSLFYPAVDFIKDKVIAIAKKEMPKGVVIDFAHVADVDTTAVQGFRELLVDLHKKGIRIVTCNLQKRVATVFRRAKPKHHSNAESVQHAVDTLLGRPTRNEGVLVCMPGEVTAVGYGSETESKENRPIDITAAGCSLEGVVYSCRF